MPATIARLDATAYEVQAATDNLIAALRMSDALLNTVTDPATSETDRAAIIAAMPNHKALVAADEQRLNRAKADYNDARGIL